MAFDTAQNIINDAAIEAGLASFGDVYASTDKNAIQMRTLLKSSGQDIVGEREWTYLQTEYNFNTVNGQADYALPGGFRNMIDQTGWNRTSRFPLGGPLSPQQWQFLKAQASQLTVIVLFRPKNGKLSLYPTPGASVQSVYFEYLTRYWVAATGAPTVPASDAPTANSDVILLDRLMMVKRLKLDFLSAKRLADQSDADEYESAFSKAANDDSAGAILSLNKRRLGVRLLDEANIPPTGFGLPG